MENIYRSALLAILCSFLIAIPPGVAKDTRFTSDEASIKYPKTFASDTLLIHTYHRLGTYFLYRDAEKALFYAKETLRIAQLHQWSKGKLLAYDLLSSYYVMDGSYDILRELSNEILTLSKKTNMPLYAANAKRFLGEASAEYKQFDLALSNLQSALEIYTTLKHDSLKALCLETMGNFYREKLEYDQAQYYYTQAFNLYQKTGSDWGMASVIEDRGYLYVRKNELETSNKYMSEALTRFRKLNKRYGILNALNDISNVYYLQKNYDSAITTAKEALNLSHRYHSSQQTNWALICLYRSYKAKNDLVNALQYLEHVDYNKRNQHIERIAHEYNLYKLIYENQQMDSEIQQKIINEQKNVQRFLIGFSCLIVAFSSFLWLNNKKLRQKNAAIKEALIQGQTIERKRVAAELHDHLGGTLASLSWYLYGINKKILSEEEIKIYNSIHQMVSSACRELRSLSHNLMPQELEEHGLIKAMERLIDKLNENNTIQFNLHINGNDKRYSKKAEFELYSIILEMTNNILKHSQASTASISLVESHKLVHLTITDNGAGIKNSSGQGVGLGNVRSRVQSLLGKIDISDDQNQGTRIEIEIPKAEVHHS